MLNDYLGLNVHGGSGGIVDGCFTMQNVQLCRLCASSYNCWARSANIRRACIEPFSLLACMQVLVLASCNVHKFIV